MLFRSPADCSTGAPTDPYVHTLMHTVPQSIVLYVAMRHIPKCAAIRCCFVDTSSDVCASAVFPNSGPMLRRLASLHRLPAGSGSPASTVLSRRYDFLSSVSRHSVSLDSRYRTDTLSFLSRWTERAGGQPLGVGHPVPPAGNLMRRRQDLSSSRETSMFRLHLFQRPRTARRSQTITGGRCCPHSVHDEDADVEYFRGSIARLSDSLSADRKSVV